MDLFPIKNPDERFYLNEAGGREGGCLSIGSTYDNERNKVFQQ
jgi:hypothetical protein